MQSEANAVAMAISFASRKDIELETFPMNPKLIQREQQKEDLLQKSKQKSPTAYSEIKIEQVSLIAHDAPVG